MTAAQLAHSIPTVLLVLTALLIVRQMVSVVDQHVLFHLILRIVLQVELRRSDRFKLSREWLG